MPNNEKVVKFRKKTCYRL